MNFLNFNKALCISPHPDDSEIGLMGTILKCSKTHFDIICLTKGGAKNYDKTNKLKRRAEVNEVWKKTKSKNVSVRHSKYEYLEDINEAGWINHIESDFLSKNNYDCILVPTFEDSNYEHRFVNNFAFALCRFSSISILEYKTLSTLNLWTPNLFIDIEKYYVKKINYLKKFTSQKNKPYFNKLVLDSFHTNFQCVKKKIKIVEKFKIIEMYN